MTGMGRQQHSTHHGASIGGDAAFVSRTSEQHIALGRVRDPENERDTMLREFREFITGLGMSAAWPSVCAALNPARASASDGVRDESQQIRSRPSR